MFAASLLAFSALPLALCVPTSSSYANLVVRDEHPDVPSGYTRLASASGQMVRLTIAMPQNNVTGLHATLLDISDPSSQSYGRHLSKSAVNQLVAPKPEAAQAVKAWLDKNAITPIFSSSAGDALTINVPVEKANTLLNANFASYVHDKTNTTMIRTLSYSVPAHLNEHIEFVAPTTHFAPPLTRSASNIARYNGPPISKRADIPASCSTTVTPACLQALYNIPTTPATASGNQLFVGGLGSDVATLGDLSTFLSQERPDFPDGTFKFFSVDNVMPFSGGSLEGSLDIQYTVGVATGVPTLYISVGGDVNTGISVTDELTMANFILQQDTVPTVLTLSYGGNEAVAGITIDNNLCNAYAQLGARGTTVIYSSGDDGVGGTSDCAAGEPFRGTFPSSCPFVTSVGSTHGFNPEVAADFSAGGFSTLFPRPDYQKDAVARYLAATGASDAYAGLFDDTGRAYPDVSMQGSFFKVIQGGQEYDTVFGTSVSAPIFASVVALVNDQLLNAGKPPLGFLNPLLYSDRFSAVFNDIVSGSNPNCGTAGFPAIAGWDPVTGLGTVDYPRMLAAVGIQPPASQPTTTTGAPGETVTGTTVKGTTGGTQSGTSTTREVLNGASSGSSAPSGTGAPASSRPNSAVRVGGVFPHLAVLVLVGLVRAWVGL